MLDEFWKNQRVSDVEHACVDMTQAVELVVLSGRSITSVARNLICDTRSAALGGKGPAGAGIAGVAPHHAGDADAGGPGFGDRPVAPGERTAIAI